MLEIATHILKLLSALTADASNPEPQSPSMPAASNNPSSPSPEFLSNPSFNSSGREGNEDMWRDLNEFNNPMDGISSEAQAIANGHAFNGHIREFPEIETREEFAQLINSIINHPSAVKTLRNERIAYWDNTSNTIVITDPNDIDSGTAFRPSAGKQYFNNLRR